MCIYILQNAYAFNYFVFVIGVLVVFFKAPILVGFFFFLILHMEFLCDIIDYICNKVYFILLVFFLSILQIFILLCIFAKLSTYFCSILWNFVLLLLIQSRTLLVVKHNHFCPSSKILVRKARPWGVG